MIISFNVMMSQFLNALMIIIIDRN